MPETAKPRKPESPASNQSGGKTPSAPSQEKRDESVVWPRDINAPQDSDPDWGSDPEAVRDA